MIEISFEISPLSLIIIIGLNSIAFRWIIFFLIPRWQVLLHSLLSFFIDFNVLFIHSRFIRCIRNTHPELNLLDRLLGSVYPKQTSGQTMRDPRNHAKKPCVATQISSNPEQFQNCCFLENLFFPFLMKMRRRFSKSRKLENSKPPDLPELSAFGRNEKWIKNTTSLHCFCLSQLQNIFRRSLYILIG